MMFPAYYECPKYNGGRVLFSGRGSVHLLETGLVLEGMLPRVWLPFIITFYRPLLCSHTARSVPYSLIEKYEPPGFINGRHLLVFRLLLKGQPARQTVVFLLKESARDEELSTRICEYMKVATTFEGRRVNHG
jgi:hypothetical protein